MGDGFVSNLLYITAPYIPRTWALKGQSHEGMQQGTTWNGVSVTSASLLCSNINDVLLQDCALQLIDWLGQARTARIDEYSIKHMNIRGAEV